MLLLDALDVAVGEFGARLDAVAPDQWSAPTPCDGWDVRYLCAHVVGGNRFAAAVLGGSTSADAMAQVLGRPQLGDAPADDLAASAADQRTAFAADGALDRTIDHPAGAITGGRFLAFRLLDLGLHAWDLARAVGADEELDAGLVSTLLDLVGDELHGSVFGIEPLGLVGPDAAPQARLLDLAGRDARPPGARR